jgi:hypothetical protein
VISKAEALKAWRETSEEERGKSWTGILQTTGDLQDAAYGEHFDPRLEAFWRNKASRRNRNDFSEPREGLWRSSAATCGRRKRPARRVNRAQTAPTSFGWSDYPYVYAGLPPQMRSCRLG